MADRPYPEAIRGVWYQLREDDDVDRARDRDTYELYLYRLDGTFTRTQLKEGVVRSQEQGTYTFDGEFLITRGRNTETYRIHPESNRRWRAETKKHTFVMHRSLYARDTIELDEKDQRDIRILPLRVKTAFPNEIMGESFVLLTFDRGGELEEPLILGEVMVEVRQSQRLCFIGITERASGISAETWTRIAREAVFDLGIGSPEGIDELEVFRFDEDALTHVELS